MALKREADEKCGLCGSWPELVLFDDGSIRGVSHRCTEWKPGLGPPDPPRIYNRGAYFPQHEDRRAIVDYWLNELELHGEWIPAANALRAALAAAGSPVSTKRNLEATK